jgi:DNA mismatch repair protein MSH3
MRSELESRVLFAAPAEVLLGEPASGETRRLMSHIGEQLGAAPRLETVAGGKYSQEGSALAAVTAFYRGGGSSEGAASPGAGPSVAQPAPSPAVITAALDGVSALPSLVLRAMAHLLQYLRPFGLAAVLRLGSQFQPWESAQEMRLSANTLRCVAACPDCQSLHGCLSPALKSRCGCHFKCRGAE